MIIEELFEFNRNVLSKEKDREVRTLKLGEFLHEKGFKSAESQQLLIDCLDSPDSDRLLFPIALFLAIIFGLVMILSNTSEVAHPVLFTISATIITVLLAGIFFMVKDMVSNKRKKISHLIRRKVAAGYLLLSED